MYHVIRHPLYVYVSSCIYIMWLILLVYYVCLRTFLILVQAKYLFKYLDLHFYVIILEMVFICLHYNSLLLSILRIISPTPPSILDKNPQKPEKNNTKKSYIVWCNSIALYCIVLYYCVVMPITISA